MKIVRHVLLLIGFVLLSQDMSIMNTVHILTDEERCTIEQLDETTWMMDGTPFCYKVRENMKLKERIKKLEGELR
jgi:hypothetical protein